MDQIFRINNTDQRITYDTNWKIIPDSGEGQDTYYSLATTPAAQFFFPFRGTSIKIYGRLGGPGGNLQFRLDGNNTNVSLNGTNVANGPTPIYSYENLKDDDHQLFVYINSLQQNGTVAVDYFEVENSSGRGFDLLWAGPNVTNVPKEAVIVDNSSPEILVSNPDQWSSASNVQYYKRSLSFTTQAGASLSYSFSGVAIWYYSDVDTLHGFFNVSIDGSTPERLNGKNNGGQLTQQMLWSRTGLSPGRHTFILTQDDVGGTYISLDFFRILRAEDASAIPSNTSASTTTFTPLPTDAQPVASPTKPNIVPLAVGLTLGLLALAIFVLCSIQYLRRRRRIAIALDAHPSPLHTVHQSTQADQQTARRRDTKRTPQSTPSSSHTTPLPIVTIATDSSTASPGVDGLGLPPSYESHRTMEERARPNNRKHLP